MPGVTASTFVGLIGLGIGIYDYQKLKTGPKIPKYKKDYIGKNTSLNLL